MVMYFPGVLQVKYARGMYHVILSICQIILSVFFTCNSIFSRFRASPCRCIVSFCPSKSATLALNASTCRRSPSTLDRFCASPLVRTSDTSFDRCASAVFRSSTTDASARANLSRRSQSNVSRRADVSSARVARRIAPCSSSRPACTAPPATPTGACARLLLKEVTSPLLPRVVLSTGDRTAGGTT